MSSPANRSSSESTYRSCAPIAVAVFDEDLVMVDSFWVEAGSGAPFAEGLLGRLESAGHRPEDVVAGIDAPRCALKEPRPFYWDAANGAWRPRREKERGWGGTVRSSWRAAGSASRSGRPRSKMRRAG